jgi:hypothetical protein
MMHEGLYGSGENVPRGIISSGYEEYKEPDLNTTTYYDGSKKVEYFGSAEEANVQALTQLKMGNVKAVETRKVGRNDPCPCGSKKKWKKCCMLSQNVLPKA